MLPGWGQASLLGSGGSGRRRQVGRRTSSRRTSTFCNASCSAPEVRPCAGRTARARGVRCLAQTACRRDQGRASDPTHLSLHIRGAAKQLLQQPRGLRHRCHPEGLVASDLQRHKLDRTAHSSVVHRQALAGGQHGRAICPCRLKCTGRPNEQTIAFLISTTHLSSSGRPPNSGMADSERWAGGRSPSRSRSRSRGRRDRDEGHRNASPPSRRDRDDGRRRSDSGDRRRRRSRSRSRSRGRYERGETAWRECRLRAGWVLEQAIGCAVVARRQRQVCPLACPHCRAAVGSPLPGCLADDRRRRSPSPRGRGGYGGRRSRSRSPRRGGRSRSPPRRGGSRSPPRRRWSPPPRGGGGREPYRRGSPGRDFRPPPQMLSGAQVLALQSRGLGLAALTCCTACAARWVAIAALLRHRT